MFSGPTLILDFDGTLWDFDSFISDIKQSGQRMGIPAEEVHACYDRAWSHPARRSGYGFDRHVQALSQCTHHDEVKLYEWLRAHHDRLGDYVFPDAHLFLHEMKDAGYNVVLLTHGDPKWQMEKFRHTGLVDHFDAIYPTRSQKHDFLHDWMKDDGGPMLFVNDNPHENFVISESFPTLAQAMRKNLAVWEEELYRKVGFPYFSTLDEIRRYAHTFFAS